MLRFAQGTQETLAELGRTFEIPSSKVSALDNPPTDLVQKFEELLDTLAKSNETHEYLIAMGHYPAIRKKLELPAAALHPGKRLSSTRSMFGGIHTEFLYVSTGKKMTIAAMHKEEVDLDSKNVNYMGLDKYWLVISPASSGRFETLVARHFSEEFLGERPRCSQFVRHLNFIPFPSLLREWDIAFRIVLQRPGDEVKTLSGAYHAVVNVPDGEVGIAGAINCCSDDWNPPLFYKDCGKACSSITSIKVRDFELVGEPREIVIDDRWEIERSASTMKNIVDSDIARKERVRPSTKKNDATPASIPVRSLRKRRTPSRVSDYSFSNTEAD